MAKQRLSRSGRWCAWRVVCLVLCVLPSAALAQAERLVIRTIDGMGCVLVELRVDDVRIPSHAVIDVGVRAPALIHPRIAAALGMTGTGEVAISFPGQNLSWPSTTAVPVELEPIETFSSENAHELDEIPAAAVLGLPAFRGVTSLSLVSGEIVHGQGAEVFERALQAGAASAAIDFEARGYGYWITARGPGDESLRIRLASGERNSRIDVNTAERLGVPDGQLERVSVGGINLSRYVVLEPSDFSVLPDPKPDINLGTDLLLKMDLVIDVPNQRLVLIPRARAETSGAVQAYLAARSRADADAVEAVIRNGLPESEVKQACRTLVRMRLDARPMDVAAARRAFTLLGSSLPVNGRAMALVRAADDAIALDRETERAYDVAEAALEVAAAWTRDDLDGVAVHHVLARRGLIALLRRDYESARRQLIAARFGLPQDPFINLWLGRLYEVTDQPVRAWSRYAQSAVADEAPIGAYNGLRRLKGDPALHERLTAHQMRMLLEGQVETIGRRPASAQRLSVSARPLIELFIDAAAAESEPVLAGWSALSQMFSQFGLVAYHFEPPLISPASVGRADRPGDAEGPQVFINGRPVAISADRGGEAWLEQLVAEVVRAEAPQEQDDLSWLAVKAASRPEALDFEVELDRSARPDRGRLRLLLVEQVVFVPGASSMAFHDWPVRAEQTYALADSLESGSALSTETVLRWNVPTGRENRSDGVSAGDMPYPIDSRVSALVAVWEDADGSCLGWKRWTLNELTTRP
ncbi:hypothetical protein [Mucisphaera calidilacus]|uniref:Uncharacterized protein n=1 Tax=Mucisphaera calidilacus TaxID=2527982 RepID=A0A518BU59_9BACT|nr:hypothetical protein [Mucisphaera calidilacus]QDU70509.1 hypothetical protein Pan265_03370 [Mucisphaera calidilacus]